MSTTTELTTYAAAIRQALHDILADDPRAFIYGQDVGGDFGGAFKITKGLAAAFPGRVLNAPISEDAISGMAVGAAVEGARPIIEFQFADFASVAFNQLTNQAGTVYWRSGRPCPFIARFPCGGVPGSGPFHSQMPENWLGHHPGLIVIAPATVADAYGMLRQAARQQDPVMFLEHKLLYERIKDPAFDPSALVPDLGRAAIRRIGSDCTIVSWSGMLHLALETAEELAAAGQADCEVLDLRCLRPFDLQAVLHSVSRTGRLVVLSEDFPTGSLAAEICAAVAEAGFALLDAPPQRVCSLDTPIPYAPALWDAHRPGRKRLVAAIETAMRF